ncbi:hypothetical protein Tco_1165001 [Tanacetum coccineum]
MHEAGVSLRIDKSKFLSSSTLLPALLHHPLNSKMWHLSLENTLADDNVVSTAYGVSVLLGHNSLYEQTSHTLTGKSIQVALNWYHEDLEQLMNELKLEEMDLKWAGGHDFNENAKVYKKGQRCVIYQGNQDNRGEMFWNSVIKDGEDMMSANDKFGLGYGDHRYDDILSYENEVLQSVFMNKESELVNQPLYDSESETQTSDFDTYESDCSVETHEPLPEPTVKEPKVVCQPKVWSDAPIIEEEVVKNQFTHSKNPTVDKKGLGYGFTTKACFVCGSLCHLIRDCDFHEKRMAKQAELNNRMSKKSSQKGDSPNLEQFNTTRASGTNNVSTARHNFNRQVVPTSAAMKVNIVKPIVNRLVLLGEKGKLLLSPQQVVIGDQKDTTGTKYPKTIVDQDLETVLSYRALQTRLLIVVCSRHMTGNKAYLSEYQDFNGGPVCFWKNFVTSRTKFFSLTLNVLFLSPEFKVPDAKSSLQEANQTAGTKDNIDAGAAKASSTNIVNTASTPVSTASPYGGLSFTDLTNTDQDDSEIPALEEIYDNPTDGIFTNSSYDDEGAVADFTNLEPVVNVSPIPTSRINSIHPSTLILGDPQSAVQTRSKVTKSSGAHAFVSYIQKQRRNNHKDFQHCLFACFLSQNEPKKISEALEDESWVDAMQEELLQFKIQKVWILVDLPYGKKAIGTKWVYRNKKDERGLMDRNVYD